MLSSQWTLLQAAGCSWASRCLLLVLQVLFLDVVDPRILQAIPWSWADTFSPSVSLSTSVCPVYHCLSSRHLSLDTLCPSPHTPSTSLFPQAASLLAPLPWTVSFPLHPSICWSLCFGGDRHQVRWGWDVVVDLGWLLGA